MAGPRQPGDRDPVPPAGRGPVELSLYGVGGRLVRRLVAATLPAGEHRHTWDGRTASGAPAPSGIYWLRLVAPGGEAVERLTVIR